MEVLPNLLGRCQVQVQLGTVEPSAEQACVSITYS